MRAWIIGNAPSIATLDMSKLKGEVTFSFNRAYLSYEDWGWYPTHYCVIDSKIIQQTTDDINRLVKSGEIRGIWLRDIGSENVILANNVHLLHFDESRDNWGFDPVNFKYCGDVAAFALQLAYSLGYREIYLAGVDQSWGTHGESKPGADTDHFRPDYETERVRMTEIYPEAHFNSWLRSIEEATVEPYNMRIMTTTKGKLNDHLYYIPFEAVL